LWTVLPPGSEGVVPSMSLADRHKADEIPVCLQNGGEMGARMRAHDWAASPLGPPALWPQSLRTATSMMLSSLQPMFIAWGPQLAFTYNDAYAPVLGGKHPDALGRAFEEVWADI